MREFRGVWGGERGRKERRKSMRGGVDFFFLFFFFLALRRERMRGNGERDAEERIGIGGLRGG